MKWFLYTLFYFTVLFTVSPILEIPFWQRAILFLLEILVVVIAEDINIYHQLFKGEDNED